MGGLYRWGPGWSATDSTHGFIYMQHNIITHVYYNMCICTTPIISTGTVTSGDMGTRTAAEKQQLQDLLTEFADVF